jgi:hypothetical protein
MIEYEIVIEGRRFQTVADGSYYPQEGDYVLVRCTDRSSIHCDRILAHRVIGSHNWGEKHLGGAGIHVSYLTERGRQASRSEGDYIAIKEVVTK